MIGPGFLRPEAIAALLRWREVGLAAMIAAVGLWIAGLGGYVFLPVGAGIAALGLGLGLLAWRRMRFANAGGAPGLVEVDEGQISYFGPNVGGFVAIPDLVEVRLATVRGNRFWRLKQSDGQALLVPVEASGAERLFDAFSALPGMDTQTLVAALTPQGQGAGRGLGVVDSAGTIGPVIWRRGTLALR